MHKGKFKIFANQSGKAFCRKIIHHLNEIIERQEFPKKVELGFGEEIIFSNKEVKYIIGESVRGKDVYIVQLFDDPLRKETINDNLIALCTAINAAKYSDAKRITAVIPQFPYARQDKIRGREPLTAKIIGALIENSGADKIITLDIHAEPIEGFFNDLKMENLHVGRKLIRYINENIKKDNLIMVAPDIGSSKRAHFFSKELGLELAIIDKLREHSKASTISKMRLVGDVMGKNVFITDDMVATGGTLINACELLKEKGAQDIHISVSLPYFSSQSYMAFDKAFEKGLFKSFIGTDAVFWGEQFVKDHPWYTELTIGDIFAEVIFSMNQDLSVSKLLE